MHKNKDKTDGYSRAPRFRVDNNWVFTNRLLHGLLQSRPEGGGHGSNLDGSRASRPMNSESGDYVELCTIVVGVKSAIAG